MESSMRTRLPAALLLALAPASARAQTVDATALTLLSGRQDVRDGVVHTVVPAIEEIAILATGLDAPGIDGLRVRVAGWGMLTGGEPVGDRATGDLDLAFVEGQLLGKRLGLRAGRQIIVGGVARNLQLDGLDAVVRAPGGFGVEVYGGVPVVPRFGGRNGDGAVGGRVSWHPGPRFEGGLSFVDVLDDSRTDRQEAGADARLLVSDEVSFAGLAALATTEMRLAEASLRALIQPRRELELTVEAARTAPDLFVSRASIFSVFAEEARTEIGGTLYVRPYAALRVWADLYGISDDSGGGGRGGLRLGWTVDRDGATVVGIEGRLVTVPDHGYLQGRAYAVRRFLPQLVATLDADLYRLDPVVNGQDLSFTATGTLAWDFARDWRAVATGLTGATPLASWRTEAMAKLVYSFHAGAK
jgi:hypothetical protein